MPEMSGSKYFAEAMKGYGLSHVFFVPTIVTPALAEMDRLGVTAVMTHGEKAAAYMADGFARISRRPGVCMAQTIGAANLAAGLRDAHLACSPLIAISGGRLPDTKHRGVYQEIDDMPLFEPLCKSTAEIDSPQRLPDLLRQAFRTATTGRPGPVYLQIGGNMGQAIEGLADLEPDFEKQFGQFPAFRPACDQDAIEKTAGLLAEAERPIIVAGGGVTASGAQAEVVELVRKLSIPLATALNAKGTIAENDPLSVGVVGLYSRECANRAVDEADLVFFIGSQTGGQVTNSWRIPRNGTRVVQLDIDGNELGRNYPNAASLCGDAKIILRDLLDAVEAREGRADWTARIAELKAEWYETYEPVRNSDETPMRPERVCKEIQEWLPGDAILVSDTGHSGIWTGTHIELRQPGQQYIRAAGSLGWGLPAAMGAKCAAPNRAVLCFTGDGGFYYHMAELETAVRYGINVVVAINNNCSLNQELEIFADAYGGRQDTGLEMWQFSNANFARIAEAMGCLGLRVESPDEIKPALEEAVESGRPAVIDIVTDINALAPPAWG